MTERVNSNTNGDASVPSYLGYLESQASAVRHLLEQRSEMTKVIAGAVLGKRPNKVFFVGSGSSRFAAELAARVWRRLLRWDVETIPTLPFLNEVHELRLNAQTVTVAVSQSGGTLALVDGLKRARKNGSMTFAVTADPSSPLAKEADVTIDSHTGAEDIYAKTKGFTTTAIAASLAGPAMAASLDSPMVDSGPTYSVGSGTGQDDLHPTSSQREFERSLGLLPNSIETTLKLARAQADTLAARFEQVRTISIVGAGNLLPAALEGSLKILEVAKLGVMSYELEESLHGPFNAFGPESGLILLADAIPQIEKLASFVRAAEFISAPIAVIASSDAIEAGLDKSIVDLTLPSLPFSQLTPLLGVIPLQLLALELARLRGVDPNTTRYPSLYGIFRTKTGQ